MLNHHTVHEDVAAVAGIVECKVATRVDLDKIILPAELLAKKVDERNKNSDIIAK